MTKQITTIIPLTIIVSVSHSGPLFTDGSAFDTGGEFGAAAFAIVQLEEQRVGAEGASCTGVPPACMQPSAATAERLAIAIATALFLAGHQASFRSDCLSAVSEAANIAA
jgi:hypothetical protein